MAVEEKPEMDSAAAMEVLAQTSMPLEVGAIEMDPQYGVRARSSDAPVNFKFTYQGVVFSAEMGLEEDAPLVLTASLGVIPFSMENAFGRKAAHAILRKAHMKQGTLKVDFQSRVFLEMKGYPERPRTPVNVISTVAALLMEAKPYMDLLEVALRRQRRRSRRPLT